MEAAAAPIVLAELDDIELLALLIAGEADNQPLAGQVATALTVPARVERKRWWYGLTPRLVMLRPFQYSTFNGAHWKQFVHRIPVYKMLAQMTLEGLTTSPTKGATHYCRFDLDPLPRWALPRYSKPYGRVADHIFFREY